LGVRGREGVARVVGQARTYEFLMGVAVAVARSRLWERNAVCERIGTKEKASGSERRE
jgi:hypothetical protein